MKLLFTIIFDTLFLYIVYVGVTYQLPIITTIATVWIATAMIINLILTRVKKTHLEEISTESSPTPWQSAQASFLQRTAY